MANADDFEDEAEYEEEEDDTELEIDDLGTDIDDDIPEATLDELGQLADPPMTKDTVSGRIRRLLATADTRATILGIPTTHAAITEELLEQL